MYTVTDLPNIYNDEEKQYFVKVAKKGERLCMSSPDCIVAIVDSDGDVIKRGMLLSDTGRRYPNVDPVAATNAGVLLKVDLDGGGEWDAEQCIATLAKVAVERGG